MAQEKSNRTMNFWEHLDELRSRIIRALAVFLVGFAISYFLVTDTVMQFLREPLYSVLPADQQHLYFTSLFENFLTHLKIAGASAIFGLAPYLFWEAWGFIAPGLYPKERGFVFPFIILATVFFVGGAAFAYYVLFPTAFSFFIHYGLATDQPMLTIDSYYSTALKLILLFGLAFEMPVMILLLGWLGVVDAATLRRQRRVAWVVIALFAAIFAPPDAVSMLLLIAPLLLLFEFSVVAVHWLARKRPSPSAP